MKKLKRCPNCDKKINKVGTGYFCRYCLNQYDKEGNRIPAMLK